MKKINVLCLLLIGLLLLPIFSVTTAAEMTLLVDEDRFACRMLSSQKSVISLTPTGEVLMSFRGKAPDLSLYSVEMSSAAECNAVRFVIENDSDCNSMRIVYTYYNEHREEESLEQELSINRRSGKQDYFLYLDEISRLRTIDIFFSGGTSGKILLYGIGAVSVCDDSAEQPGEIFDCVYDPAGSRVTISGTIHHEVAVNTRSAEVVLYAFDANESVDRELLKKADPIAAVPFSVRFEMSVPAATYAERFMQYVAAIVNREGEILYQYAPVVPCISEKNDGEKTNNGFKGAETDYTSLATSADMGLAVVDVFLDRLQSEKNNGLLHMTEGSYFYVNRAYIAELDDEIGQYSRNGSQIYLRFLISGDGQSVFRNDAVESDDAAYCGVILKDEMDFLTLYAYTEFLCTRYSAKGTEKIDGIILGHSVDRAREYNAMGDMDLKAYTEAYANALYAVSEASKRIDPSIELVVPISDEWDRDRVSEDPLGIYPSRLFLISLCKRTANHYGRGLSFRVMMDSATLPDIIESKDADFSCVSVDDITDWKKEMAVLAEEYERMKDGLIYCWRPSENLTESQVLSAYAYSYYKLSMNGVYSFVLEADRVEDEGILRALFDLAKYIDTPLGAEKSQPLLEELGGTAWVELIPGFLPSLVEKHRVYRYNTTFSPSALLRGRYIMWDHNQGRSVHDWFASRDCSALLVNDAKGIGRALMTTASGKALCSELVYAFSVSEIMGVVDMFSIEVLIGGEPGETYNLVFEVCGEQSSCISTARVKSGEIATLYVSTLQLDMSEDVRNIRLLTSPASGEYSAYTIHVSHLSAHSNTLNGDALEEAIVNARLEALSGEQMQDDETPFVKVGVGIIIAILCLSAVIIVIISKRAED